MYISIAEKMSTAMKNGTLSFKPVRRCFVEKQYSYKISHDTLYLNINYTNFDYRDFINIGLPRLNSLKLSSESKWSGGGYSDVNHNISDPRYGRASAEEYENQEMVNWMRLNHVVLFSLLQMMD